MESGRLDTLARFLAGGLSQRKEGPSRRGILAGLLGLAAGLLGSRTSAAICPSNQVYRPRVGCICRTTGRPPVGGRCPCSAHEPVCGPCPFTGPGTVCGGCAVGACNCGGPANNFKFVCEVCDENGCCARRTYPDSDCFP